MKSNEELNATIAHQGPEAKRTCIETCVHVFKNVTVEPTVFLFLIGYMIANLTSSNLGLEKACRVNLNFTDEICQAMRDQTLDSQNEYEMETQKLVARATAWKSYITATIPCAMGLFVGTWQDKTGHRKIFILIPLVGQMIGCLNSMLNVYFLNELNLEVLFLTESFLEALSGSLCVITITIYSFISAITTEKERTFRLGLVNCALMVGLPTGTASSGILLKTLGYYGAYGIAFGVHFINLMYNSFILKNPKRTAENKKHDKQGVRHFFETLFDLSNIKETLKIVFKKVTNKRRLRICLLLVVVAILNGLTFGESSILYMSTRYRFNWDEVIFSLFQAYNFLTLLVGSISHTLLHLVGTLFSITVFSKILHWHDSMLGIISTVSKILGCLMYALAPNGKIFFFAPIVEILHGSCMLALRPILSKLVAPDELGKINSIIGLTEYLVPLAYVPLYTQLYIATIEVFPGAVFLLGAIMIIPAVLIFVWLFVEHRMGTRKNRSESGTDSPIIHTKR